MIRRTPLEHKHRVALKMVAIQAGWYGNKLHSRMVVLSTLYSNYNRISSEKMYLNIINEFLIREYAWIYLFLINLNYMLNITELLAIAVM